MKKIIEQDRVSDISIHLDDFSAELIEIYGIQNLDHLTIERNKVYQVIEALHDLSNLDSCPELEYKLNFGYGQFGNGVILDDTKISDVVDYLKTHFIIIQKQD